MLHIETYISCLNMLSIYNAEKFAVHTTGVMSIFLNLEYVFEKHNGY